jgi:hypothetical protein
MSMSCDLLCGLTIVAAGLVADHLGPVMGGLFLAFPAIFAASATLIEKHERERKAKKGLRGEKRAKGAAALDASGAAWGSIGLAAFGAVIWGRPQARRPWSVSGSPR